MTACETKPIVPGCPEMGADRRDRGQSLAPGGSIVRNKANLGLGGTRPGGGHAKQTQFGTVPQRGVRDMAYKQTQFPRVRAGAGDRLCETKPIGQAHPQAVQDVLYKQTHFRRVQAGVGVQLCKTNPMPNGHVAPAIPLFHHSSVPIRCRSCETKPIATPCRSGDRRSQGPSVRNKANWRGPAAESVGSAGQTNPILGSPAGSRGPIMQNKPNLGRRASKHKCFMRTRLRRIGHTRSHGKTKPIPRSAGGVPAETSRITPYGVTTNARASVRNKAKFGQDGMPGERCTRELIVQNKANFPTETASPTIPLFYHSTIPVGRCVVRILLKIMEMWKAGLFRPA